MKLSTHHVSINSPCNKPQAPQLASLEKLETSRVCKKGKVFLLDTHFLMSWFKKVIIVVDCLDHHTFACVRTQRFSRGLYIIIFRLWLLKDFWNSLHKIIKCFILCNTKKFSTWKMTKTEIGFVVELRAPNMMFSWNGSLYVRKNEPPKYLQKMLLKNEYRNPRRPLKQYYNIL